MIKNLGKLFKYTRCSPSLTLYADDYKRKIRPSKSEGSGVFGARKVVVNVFFQVQKNFVKFTKFCVYDAVSKKRAL